MYPWPHIKFVIVAHTRSGGTFLAHCLSNHTQIFCDRGEPLLSGFSYKRYLDRPEQILDLVWRACHYRVAGCKITYKQFSPAVEGHCIANNVKVIHLRRENLLRVVVSQAITGMVQTGKLENHVAHSDEILAPIKIHLPAPALCGRIAKMEEAIEDMTRRLSKFDTYPLTYNRLVGGEDQMTTTEIPGNEGPELCEFLGVKYEPLHASLKRVNRYPLSKMLSNWTTFAYRVREEGYGHLLEGV